VYFSAFIVGLPVPLWQHYLDLCIFYATVFCLLFGEFRRVHADYADYADYVLETRILGF